MGRLAAGVLGALVAASIGLGANGAAAATKPAPFRRGLGMPVTQTLGVTSASVSAQSTAGTTYPAQVNLTGDAPPPGDQGMVNSCVSWAIDYTTMGYYLRRHSIAGFPLAPMYTYAQLVHGQNVGTFFEDTFAIAQSQGVDTRADYRQGDYDYTTQPTASEIANAANWKLSNYETLALGVSPSTTTNAIKASLVAGKPVVLGIPVYDNFYALGPGHSDLSTPQGTNYGGHAVTALGYDSYGVTIENSWGTGWGAAGFARLSWSFVTHQVFAAYAVGDVLATNPNAPHITKIVPPAGRATGGQRVTITGSNFTAGTTVTFGGVPGTAVRIDSTHTHIRVTTPLHSARAVNVQVHNGLGASPTWDNTVFKFVDRPSPTKLTPSAGPAKGGSHMVITGLRLNETSVTVGGKPAKVLAANSTRMIVSAPAGQRGAKGTVVLRNAAGYSGAGTYTWR